MVPPMIRIMRKLASTVLAAALLAASLGGADAQRRGTGLPLPRFVSLKAETAYVRRGPGQEYGVAFVYVKPGVPLEITQEFDTWRKVRDAEGAEGWIFHSLLSGKRTALVTPWENGGPFALRRSASSEGAIVAYLQPKVLADVEECTGTWCRVAVSGIDGWIEQERLWGVYPNEEFEE
jgi:SH3-like domain-containing protein